MSYSGRLVFIGTITLALAVTLGLAVVIMQPPAKDIVELGLIFGATGLGATLLGFLSHRTGWWARTSSLSQSLTAGHLLAALVGLVIVWLAARLMFINKHDLTLAGLLLLFASTVSVSFGYFLSSSITNRLRKLDRAALRLSQGDFSTRVSIAGRDEVAQLGRAFNTMALRLERAEAEAAQLDRARRDFIAGASHDLRTPLASLRAMLDAIADEVADDPIDYIQRCLRVIAQLTRLTEDLVELARLDSETAPLELAPGSITVLVRRAIEGAAHSAQEKEIDLGQSGEAGEVWMSEDAIARVLQNLLDNAIRHTRHRGRVWVSFAERNGAVHVSVEDSGEGIPAEQLPYIFDRFYRGEKSRTKEGVGLGLAIAKELIEAHGGRIWAESAPERGTRITFSLAREMHPQMAAGS